jgi:O-antigen ligase
VSASQVIASLIAILLIGASGWLSWRKPTALLVVALASLSVRPQLFFGGAPVGYEWGLHHTLLFLALVVHALHFGVRRNLHWPVAGLLAAFALSLAAGELHPKLTPGFMAMSLGVLALPWCCASVVLEPGSRRVLALVIMLTPLLSVTLGVFMAAAGVRPSFLELHRMEGATGNAAAFAILAFAGFAVAVHEMSRRNRPLAGGLAVLNLALVVLSGTRMAIAASGAFLIVYLLLSHGLRQRLRQHHARTAAGIAVVAATLLWYWPTLRARLFDRGHDLAGVSIATVDGSLNLSNRIEIWTFYFEEFMFSPLFGRGIGVGFVAAADWLPWPRMTPHNEYLHLLVSVGVVGFVLCAGAIAVWYRRLLQMASDNDRLFLIALIPAIGLFAITDDVLAFSTGLALFAYLGVLLTRRAPEMTFRHVRRRHRSRPRTRGARGVRTA